MAAAPAAAPTPPRLSFIDGEVGFHRPGSDEWSAARLNTPLAPGDALYANDKANLELQIGSRAFVRIAERTQLSLVNRDGGYLQFSVPDGQASFDLRTLPAGFVLEVDTPNAAFTITHTGYYRLSVQKGSTYFITRRGGRATLAPARGNSFSVAPSEEVVVEGTDAPTVASYVAPELDTWDEWNYARTEHLVDTVSARYLPPDVSGTEELDHYGDWRQVPDYGTVWIPAGLSTGWAPYSNGQWTWDPFYGWTWIDDAPWGWAPFHYGRWIFINGFWAWTPGPTAAAPVYSPALVTFFTARRGAAISIGGGVAAVSWVALSWGEPLIPWWGPAGFVGVPSWRGWGGPRVVNNAVINRTAVVDVAKLNFRNSKVPAAIVSVPQQQFGRGPVRGASVSVPTLTHIAPVIGALPVKPAPESFAAGAASKVKPGAEVLSRPVVTLRAPAQTRPPWRAAAPSGAEIAKTPEPRIVLQPKREQAAPPRASFGLQGGPERAAPSLPPRFEEMRRSAPPPVAAPSREIHERAVPPRQAEPAAPETARGRVSPSGAEPQRSIRPEVASPHEAPRPERNLDRVVPSHEAAKPERGIGEARPLPGEPANRMSPRRQKMESSHTPPGQ